jgi:hypothetical protein
MPLKTSLRRAIYLVEKLVQRARFTSLPEPPNGWPVLLGISFPKSGTHLLDQILLGFNRVAPFSLRLHSFYAEYEGKSGRKRAPGQALRWLDSLKPADIASAHLFARTEAVAHVITPFFVPYFIFRDPRDVVVSHVYYVTEMEQKHVHHTYYQSLPDFEARLKISILGIPDSNVDFPDIAGRFAPYMDWLDQPSVMKIHFEDLIHDRTGTLNRIVDRFLERVPLKTEQNPGTQKGMLLESLENSIQPAKSPTFRSGKTGSWKKQFTNEHKKIFKDTAGDLLIKLGYEKNNDW